MEGERLVVVCVSSAGGNTARRRSVRRSWFRLKTESNPFLSDEQRARVELCFVVSSTAGGGDELAAEQEEHRDMLLLETPEGYQHLWRKALASLEALERSPRAYRYYMHADDDSYVRLDLLVPLLDASPRESLYWGYVWDGAAGRATAPIRDTRNKSHMPAEQYPLDFYPPFASGCGFVLSRDLVRALLRQPLPDYRLLDPPFGIHLCGAERCVLPGGPIAPVHCDAVRPYRGIPIFCASTVVQHYLAPEEMAPYHQQALEAARQAQLRRQQCSGSGSGSGAAAASSSSGGGGSGEQQQQHQPSPADELYAHLVGLGLLRR